MLQVTLGLLLVPQLVPRVARKGAREQSFQLPHASCHRPGSNVLHPQPGHGHVWAVHAPCAFECRTLHAQTNILSLLLIAVAAGDVTLNGEVLRVQSIVVCTTELHADGSQNVRYSFHDRVRGTFVLHAS